MTPGHRITITPADLHVEVAVNGTTVAVSDHPVLLDETGLPTRYYLPPEDVRADVLRPSKSETTCPFKGQASYYSVEVDGETFHDLVWRYDTPIPDAAPIAGLLCFYNERVDLTVDGAALTRPETPFAR
jgi:uncharacterized protein (DUF427 family)